MIETEKEKINFNAGYDEQVIQVIFDEDIIVPDAKDDIEDIIQVDRDVHIKKNNLNGNKLDYEGSIEYDILYVGAKNEKSIYNIVGDIPFADSVNVENVKFDDYTLSAEIEHLQYTILNSRKINLKVVVNLKLKTEKSIEKQMISVKSDNDIQTLVDYITIDQKADRRVENINVRDTITIPSSKPSVKNILKCNILLRNVDVRILEGKIGIKGNINVTMIYNNYENSIELLEYDIPLNEIIDNVNSDENMIDISNFEIQDKYVEVLSDDEGEERIINVEADILAKIDLVTSREKEVLKDAYSTSKKLNLQKENIQYDKIYLKNKNSSNIKETVKINPADTVLQIYNVDAKIKIDSVEVKNGNIEVFGTIDCKILYIVADDKYPIKSQDNRIPFSQILDANNISDNMKVNLGANIEHISFNMMAKNEMEIKINLVLDAVIIDKMDAQIVTGIEEGETINFNDYPSMIVYIVKESDDLWDIAKKYNVKVEDIINLNNLEDKDDIYVGKKLVILKNTNVA